MTTSLYRLLSVKTLSAVIFISNVPLSCIHALQINFVAGAKVLITADEGVRGGKQIPLKKTVDEAVSQCSTIETVFVAQRTGADVPMHYGRDVFLNQVCTLHLSFRMLAQ